MKKLSKLKKAGIIAAVSLPLILGGLTLKNSKGLEGKVMPRIEMSTAQAKETNPDGYEVPDLTGLTPYEKGYSKNEKGLYLEKFFTEDGGRVTRFSYDNGKERNVFGYAIDHDRKKPIDYAIHDDDGDGIFESKYGPDEEVEIPDWAKS